MPSQAMQHSIDALRDRRQARAGQAVSPTVDLTSSGASMTERADEDPISTPEMLRQFAADYLAGAGVDVTLEVGEGLPHVYQLLPGTPEAAEATERIGKFLRARVH